jgi:hypothetical protein
VHSECKMSTNYFSCSGGPRVDPTKSHQDTLHRTCVFASGAICGSPSAFGCVCGAKRECTIFHARVCLVRIPQKACWDTSHGTCVFHLVRCGASTAQNFNALFFMIWWAQCGSHKMRVGIHSAKLVFLHLGESMGHVKRSGASGM